MSAIFAFLLILIINIGVIILHAYAAIITYGWTFYLLMMLVLLASWLSMMSVFHVRTYRIRVPREDITQE